MIKRKIFCQPIFVIMCCLVFFKPIALWNRFPFNIFLQISQIIVWIIITLVALERIKQWKSYLYIWTLFSIMSLYSTIQYQTDTMINSVELELSFLFLIHFLDILFSLDKIKYLKLLWLYLFISEILELITIPLYKKNIISIAWFGIKTRSTDAAIPFILLTILLHKVIGKRSMYFAIIIAILTIILLKNTTGIIALIVIICLMYFDSKKITEKTLEILHPSVIIGISILATVSVVFLNIQSKILTVLTALKGNSAMAITLSGRTEFWPNGINELCKATGFLKYFGTGFHNAEKFCFWKRTQTFLEAHCMLLQLLHDNGVLGTIVFYLALYLMMANVKRCKNLKHKHMIMIFCFAYLIICITEIYSYYPYFYIVFLIAAKSPEISFVLENKLKIKDNINKKFFR